MEEDGFVLVKRKKNTRSHCNHPKNQGLSQHNEILPKSYLSSSEGPDISADEINSIHKRVLASKVEITSDQIWDFLSNLLKTVHSSENIQEVVCYGLGSLFDGHGTYASRQQLALLLAIRDILAVPVTLFDPVFSKHDIRLLNGLQLSILTENDSGKHFAERKTLFFMPRCPFELFNNLLWKNWNCLSNIILLGNDLNCLETQLTYSELTSKYHFIHLAFPLMRTHKIAVKSSSLENVMNNSALHIFHAADEHKLSQEMLWRLEPHYI